jgi:hypothetical protein
MSTAVVCYGLTGNVGDFQEVCWGLILIKNVVGMLFFFGHSIVSDTKAECRSSMSLSLAERLTLDSFGYVRSLVLRSHPIGRS